MKIKCIVDFADASFKIMILVMNGLDFKIERGVRICTWNQWGIVILEFNNVYWDSNGYRHIGAF